MQQVPAWQNEGELETQKLLILVGLPGSGKTTLAEALISSIPGPSDGRRRWVRASQDDAPSRRRQECEAMVRNGLQAGFNVVVDRVGFDRTQRSHFIRIAQTLQPKPVILALVLQVSPQTLEARLMQRPYHPTLKDPETALRVLRQMRREFCPPRVTDCEGFDRIVELGESDQPENGAWRAREVVERVEKSGAIEIGDAGNSQVQPSNTFIGTYPPSGHYRPPPSGYRGSFVNGNNQSQYHQYQQYQPVNQHRAYGYTTRPPNHTNPYLASQQPESQARPP